MIRLVCAGTSFPDECEQMLSVNTDSCAATNKYEITLSVLKQTTTSLGANIYTLSRLIEGSTHHNVTEKLEMCKQEYDGIYDNSKKTRKVLKNGQIRMDKAMNLVLSMAELNLDVLAFCERTIGVAYKSYNESNKRAKRFHEILKAITHLDNL